MSSPHPLIPTDAIGIAYTVYELYDSKDDPLSVIYAYALFVVKFMDIFEGPPMLLL